jgi:branched-chain amino acid transport system substrate-binding protein
VDRIDRLLRRGFKNVQEVTMKRFAIPIVTGFALLVTFLGCQLAPKELKVAILAPISGDYALAGAFARDGALLAVGEWNANGGVLGKKITPIVEDSLGNPTSAVTAANKAITTDKAHYIVGEVFSSASIAISDVANSAKVIQISPTSTDASVTVTDSGATKTYVFRACFIDPFQGKAAATFAVNNLKAKKAFVLCDRNDAYASGVADAFAATFTRLGGAIVGKESYSSYDIDFSKVLGQIRRAKPDVVCFPALRYEAVNTVLQQAREKSIRTTFLGSDAWDTPQLDRVAGDGSYYTTHFWAGDPRPEVQSFLKKYGDKYKDASGNPIVPDFIAALAYDAANLLLTAIRNAGADSADKVKTAMEQISFNAVTGRITMDAQHNAVKNVVIVHVTGGKVVFDSSISP